jgi:hypothetical protein
VLIRVLVSAVAGAAATFIVAWSISLASLEMRMHSAILLAGGARGWESASSPPDGWPPEKFVTLSSHGAILEEECAWPESPGSTRHSLRYSVGWPYLSVRATSRTWSELTGPRTVTTHWTHNGLLLPARYFQDSLTMMHKWPLPIRPLWPGFAIDTAFYGTLAFLFWSAPGFVWRTRRRRRGLCVGCGYELRGMQKCPECGRQ